MNKNIIDYINNKHISMTFIMRNIKVKFYMNIDNMYIEFKSFNEKFKLSNLNKYTFLNLYHMFRVINQPKTIVELMVNEFGEIDRIIFITETRKYFKRNIFYIKNN